MAETTHAMVIRVEMIAENFMIEERVRSGGAE
jgi:hypothetical protein